MTGGSILHGFSPHYNGSMQGISPCRAVDPNGGGSGESWVTTDNYISKNI
jgi:hypothetical protein